MMNFIFPGKGKDSSSSALPEELEKLRIKPATEQVNHGLGIFGNTVNNTVNPSVNVNNRLHHGSNNLKENQTTEALIVDTLTSKGGFLACTDGNGAMPLGMANGNAAPLLNPKPKRKVPLGVLKLDTMGANNIVRKGPSTPTDPQLQSWRFSPSSPRLLYSRNSNSCNSPLPFAMDEDLMIPTTTATPSVPVSAPDDCLASACAELQQIFASNTNKSPPISSYH